MKLGLFTFYSVIGVISVFRIRLTVCNRVDSWGYSGSTGPGMPHSSRVDFSSGGGGGYGKSPPSSSSYWNGGGGGGDGGGVGSGDGVGICASGLNSSPNGLVLSNSSIA